MIEDRLHALRTQARKHQVSPDELPQLHNTLRSKLAELDDQSGGLAQLTAAEAKLPTLTEQVRKRCRHGGARPQHSLMQALWQNCRR